MTDFITPKPEVDRNNSWPRRALIGSAIASGIFISGLLFVAQRDSDTGGAVETVDATAPVVSEAAPVTPAVEPAAEPVVVDEGVDDTTLIPIDLFDDGPFADVDPGLGGDVPFPPDETGDEDPFDDDDPFATYDQGLKEVCIYLDHGTNDSTLYFSGRTYGFETGFVFVLGSTLNSGETVQIPVTDGVFDGPVAVSRFGEHQLDTFALGVDPTGADSIDLLPTLDTGPGTIIPVGPDNGPTFDTECFDFDPVGAEADVATETQQQAETETQNTNASDPAPDHIVQEFMDNFAAHHRAGDSEALLDSLHPLVRLSFGEQVCTDYVNNTTGGLIEARVIETGVVQALEMNTPEGPITFPEAIPFTVEFILMDGSAVVNDAHLPINGDQAYWLTMCGVDLP